MKEQPYYMLLRRGFVQRMVLDVDGKPSLVWPVAKTHQDAKRLCNRIGKRGIVPALVGSVPGETLEGHIAMAIDEGCIGSTCVLGWEDTARAEAAP